MIGGVAIAAGLERTLRRLVRSVHAVAVPESGAGRLAAVVALDRYDDGDVEAVAHAALKAVNLVKLVTVVDDDVDPWDDAAVAHAIATRVHFDRDLHVVPGMRADRAEPLERDGVIAKLAIDATRKRARPRRLDACGAPAVTIDAATVGRLSQDARRGARGCRADRRGADGRRLGNRARRARAGHRAGRQAGAPAPAGDRGVDRPGAPHRHRGGRAAAGGEAHPRLRPSGRRQRFARARRRVAARAVRLAQLAGRDARRPRARRVRLLGRRHARAPALRDGGRRRGRGRVRRLRGLREAPARAVSRNRDRAPPPPRGCAHTARRRAARQPRVPRARRLRTQEHPARARRRLDPRRGGRARREPGLRSRLLPRLPPAHGRAEATARRRRAARSPPASRRPTSAGRDC